MESDESSDSEYWSDDELTDTVQALSEGMTFVSAADGVSAVRDYALQQKKSVVVPRHSGADRKIVCTGAPRCGFFVQLYRRSETVRGKRVWKHWYVSSLNLDHKHCLSTPKPTAKQISKLAGFAASLRTNNAVTSDDIIQQMQETNGVVLEKMKRKVYRAMEHVREQSADEAFRSFGLIEQYLTAFGNANPGTFTSVEKATPTTKGTRNLDALPWLSVPRVSELPVLTAATRRASNSQVFKFISSAVTGTLRTSR
jgi:hypothetical protein